MVNNEEAKVKDRIFKICIGMQLKLYLKKRVLKGNIIF